MNRCTAPKGIGETRYVFGRCTWHGPIAMAGTSLRRVEVSSHGDDRPRFETLDVPSCPHCGSALFEMSEAEWWGLVQRQERTLPGYEAMMRWSQGKCFPDFDTLQNAYRQAMEGQN